MNLSDYKENQMSPFTNLKSDTTVVAKNLGTANKKLASTEYQQMFGVPKLFEQITYESITNSMATGLFD